MEVAPDAVDLPEPGPQRRRWNADNPVVQGTGRIRLPLGGKLVIGFGVVAALLALVGALGLLALSQSNSRGKQLRELQEQAVYTQLLLSDATQLESATNYLLHSRASTPLQTLISSNVAQLCVDAATCTIAGTPRSARLSVASIDHAQTTQARASALVTKNDRSFGDSRDLLIGVVSGSVVLALALGLLLSWSVVVPLRRTGGRVSEIAAGDFSGHVDVANRDEIGALATDINRMNDELEGLYRELETAQTEPDEIAITADDRRLRQIVFNLLSNAIKFTPPDGRVDASTRLDEGHVEADTGPGIAPEHLETIFEEFEQAGDGKQAEEGAGLGLPRSRKLVVHGGRLWVESEVGLGSTFRFTLPVEASM
jgi:signal transduction histidine kinase